MSKKIFISHSVNDKKLVDSFVDLLQTGANISSSDIFCSSLEGMGIPAGKNFIEFIKEELEKPDAVIVIMSKNYLFSQFCLCELGASWILSSSILPIIVEPLTFEDIKGVLTGTQATRLSDSKDLNTFVISLNKNIDNKQFNFARWEVKRDQFQSGVGEIIATLPKPKTVTDKEFQEIKENYESAKKELKKMMADIDEATRINEELKKLKDKDEIRAVLLKSMNEKEKFDHILATTKEVLDRNDSVVNYALFKYYLGEDIIINNYFEQKELADDSKHASDNDYLIDNSGSYSLNMEDPSVSRSVDILNVLKEILDSLSPELYDLLEDEYNLRPKIENKRFWSDVLDLRINYW